MGTPSGLEEFSFNTFKSSATDCWVMRTLSAEVMQPLLKAILNTTFTTKQKIIGCVLSLIVSPACETIVEGDLRGLQNCLGTVGLSFRIHAVVFHLNLESQVQQNIVWHKEVNLNRNCSIRGCQKRVTGNRKLFSTTKN